MTTDYEAFLASAIGVGTREDAIRFFCLFCKATPTRVCSTTGYRKDNLYVEYPNLHGDRWRLSERAGEQERRALQSIGWYQP